MSKLSHRDALEEISKWSSDDVVTLLQKHGLKDCCPVIMKRQVDGDALIHLTEGKLSLWKTELSRPLLWSFGRFIKEVTKNPGCYVQPEITEVDQRDSRFIREVTKNPGCYIQPEITEVDQRDSHSDSGSWDTDFECEPEDCSNVRDNSSRPQGATNLKKRYSRNSQQMFPNNKKQHFAKRPEIEDENIYSNNDTDPEETEQPRPEYPKFPKKQPSRLYNHKGTTLNKSDFRQNQTAFQNNDAEVSETDNENIYSNHDISMEAEQEKLNVPQKNPSRLYDMSNNTLVEKLREQLRLIDEQKQNSDKNHEILSQNPKTMEREQPKGTFLHGPDLISVLSQSRVGEPDSSETQKPKPVLRQTRSAPRPPVPTTKPNVRNEIQKQQPFLSQNKTVQGPPVQRNFMSQKQEHESQTKSGPVPPVPTTKPNVRNEMQKQQSFLSQNKTVQGPPVQRNFMSQKQEHESQTNSGPVPPVPATKPGFLNKIAKENPGLPQTRTESRPPVLPTKPDVRNEMQNRKPNLLQNKPVSGFSVQKNLITKKQEQESILPERNTLKNLTAQTNSGKLDFMTEKWEPRTGVAGKKDLQTPPKPIINGKPESTEMQTQMSKAKGLLEKKIVATPEPSEIRKQRLSLSEKRPLPDPPEPNRNLKKSPTADRKNMALPKPPVMLKNFDLVANLPTGTTDSDDEYESFDEQIIKQHQEIAGSKQSLTDTLKSSMESIYKPPSMSSLEEEEYEDGEPTYESICEQPDEEEDYIPPIRKPRENLPPERPIKPSSKSPTPAPSPTMSLPRPKQKNVCGQLMNGLGGRLADEVADMIVSIKRGLLRCCYSQPPEPPERSPDKKSFTLPHPGSSTSLAAERASRPLPPPPDRKPARQTDVPDRNTNRESYTDKPWFHNVDRKEASALIMQPPADLYCVPNGYFLFRPSSTDPSNPLTLVLWFDDKVYNVPVRKRPDYRFALGSPKTNEQTFATVDEMVSFYRKERLVLHSGGVERGSTKLELCVEKRD